MHVYSALRTDDPLYSESWTVYLLVCWDYGHTQRHMMYMNRQGCRSSVRLKSWIGISKFRTFGLPHLTGNGLPNFLKAS